MEPHKFKLGQSVELLRKEPHLKPLGRFEVIRIMPTEHGQRQYRIRSSFDGHERVAIEADLTGLRSDSLASAESGIAKPSRDEQARTKQTRRR